jgi:hypothetical protein
MRGLPIYSVSMGVLLRGFENPLKSASQPIGLFGIAPLKPGRPGRASPTSDLHLCTVDSGLLKLAEYPCRMRTQALAPKPRVGMSRDEWSRPSDIKRCRPSQSVARCINSLHHHLHIASHLRLQSCGASANIYTTRIFQTRPNRHHESPPTWSHRQPRFTSRSSTAHPRPQRRRIRAIIFQT